MGKKKRLPPHSSFFKSHIHFSILYLYECTSINQSQVVSLFFSLYLIQLLPLPPRPRREGYFLCPFKKKKQHIFCLSLFLFSHILFVQSTKKAKNQMRQCYADPACCSLKSILKPFPLTKKNTLDSLIEYSKLSKNIRKVQRERERERD